MRWILPLASLAVLAPMVADAQGTQPGRDIPWYMANPRAMEETLRRCARDARTQDTYDCRNADAAATQLRADRNAAPGLQTLQERDLDPARNPVLYGQFVRACERRDRGIPAEFFDRDLYEFCDRVDRTRSTVPPRPHSGQRQNGK